jgi:hypothetical protein
MKPWLRRAIRNGSLGSVAGFCLPPVLALLMTGWSIIHGTPDYRIMNLFTSQKVQGEFLIVSLLFAFMGFFIGVSSTPIYKNPPLRKDKYKVLSIGILFNTFLPPYLGTLMSPEASYAKLLPLGLFMGLPSTILVCIHFHDKGLKRFLGKNDKVANKGSP